jgi:cation diffusion facilitator CzcD-associated flavoprotein CzcO
LHGQKQNDERDDWLLDRPLQDDLSRWDSHIASLKIADHAKLHSNVVSVAPQPDGTFQTSVSVGEEGGMEEPTITTVYTSKNVVACNGCFDTNITPKDLAAQMPDSIQQHTSGGFRLRDLKPGNVMIVGSSQSGCQIANILLDEPPQE